MTSIALEMQGVSKRFGAVTALDDVSFAAKHGSIHALLGENGAGKTTLMRIAFGMLRADAGWTAVNGNRIDVRSPSDAIAAGVGMVHQQFSLVPSMSVSENVALGRSGRFRPEVVAAQIEAIGARTGLTLNPFAQVSDLGSAERQKLEIIRILAHDARILILDEPTAVLTSRDIGELFMQLRAFADAGGCVVLITHKLRDALAHADEVTVLRRGRVALNAAMASVDRRSLTTAMLGTATGDTTPDRPPFVLREVVASLDCTTKGPHEAKSLRFEIRGGEILGVAALDGAAASLLRLLAGKIKPASGVVSIPGHIGFVPENRQDEAIIPAFTLSENFALKNAGARSGLLGWNEMHERAASVIDGFEVRASGPDASAASLSGGNQQRFVLGRELQDDPPLLVLENPTQGLDVSAAAAIHARVRDAAARGTAIVFYSSDLDELVEISNRVLVVRSSGIGFSEPDRDAIGRLLLEENG